MAADITAVEPAACPLLGLASDPRTRFRFAVTSHRCYAAAKPAPIELGHQGVLCLSAAYPECGRFRAAQAAGRVEAPTLQPVAGGYVGPAELLRPVASVKATPLRVEQRPRPRRIIMRAVRLLVLAAVLAVLGLAGGNIAGGWLRNDGLTGGPAPSRPAGVTAAPGATPTDASAPQPTPDPSASQIPTPQPTASEARTPTAAPTSRIHVVVRGETLSSIAARYGVTIEAIQDANQIADPSLIQVGQRLVIPPSP